LTGMWFDVPRARTCIQSSKMHTTAAARRLNHGRRRHP